MTLDRKSVWDSVSVSVGQLKTELDIEWLSLSSSPAPWRVSVTQDRSSELDSGHSYILIGCLWIKISGENSFTLKKIHNFSGTTIRGRFRVKIRNHRHWLLGAGECDTRSELDIPPDPPSPGMSRRPHKLERNVTMRGNDRPQTIPECPPWKIWRLRQTDTCMPYVSLIEVNSFYSSILEEMRRWLTMLQVRWPSLAQSALKLARLADWAVHARAWLQSMLEVQCGNERARLSAANSAIDRKQWPGPAHPGNCQIMGTQGLKQNIKPFLSCQKCSFSPIA